MKVLLRQLKAVERGYCRLQEAVRAQQRHVKQRRLSRTFARTHKLDLHWRVVLLFGYWSGGGCPTCGYGGVESEDAMMDILEQAFGVSTEKPFMASAEDFLDYAQRLVDPAMTLRRAMPEDVGYRSLDALYATYTLFYSRVLRRLSSSRGHKHVDTAIVAAWSPREWTPLGYNSVAMWRGWLFRHRMLYSPHTDLGHRYLLRAWHRECSAQT
ncbi:hypothetical protein COCOBI_08-5110 [Coccomyxa sp. Obi]|nr:hypothetical protein COCOBI_08-5110 [Coccomyxa sp. Obi]